jgi:PAS domain S-box-containing protein
MIDYFKKQSLYQFTALALFLILALIGLFLAATFHIKNYTIELIIILAGVVAISISLSLLLYLLAQRSKQLQQALQKQEEYVLILERANEGFISINEQNIITNWNPHATLLFGWTKEEVLNKPLDQFIIPPQYRKMHSEGIKKFLNTGHGPVLNKTVEITGYHRSKEEFPIELTVFGFEMDSKYTFHAFIRDIAERKAIDKMKDEFIATVSHELRTPITSVKGALSLLKDATEDSLTTKNTLLLATAYKNCERLTYLINDILDIEKIEAGKFTLFSEEINLTLLLKDTIKLNEDYAKTYNIDIVLENNEDTKILGDYFKLQQVITNLISNAVKFSNEGDIVTIRILKKKKTVQIEFNDTGVGIPEEFQSQIFQKFSQSHFKNTRYKGGTGLGLSITKSIIELHQGKINFISNENEGTTFCVELPRIQD